MKYALAIWIAVSCLLGSATAAGANRDRFPISDHGLETDHYHISDTGTANARVRGAVTLDDLKRDCEDQGRSDCPVAELTAQWKHYHPFDIKANCPKGILISDMGEILLRQGDGMWIRKNPAIGQDREIDSSGASGGTLFDEQFDLLCPPSGQ